jgi:hypothetical protein
MSPVRRRPEKRCSMTSALVVMVAGIVSRAGPESCMTLSSSSTSTVFVGLL